MKLLQRLFGSPSAAKKAETTPAAPDVPAPRTASSKEATSRYYETMTAMQKAVSRQDYGAAAAAVRDNLTFMAAWAKAQRSDYGSFQISSIPTIEQGGTVLAVVGDDGTLREMAKTVSMDADLAAWLERVEQSVRDSHTVRAIVKAVEASPGCLQSDLKQLVGEEDGSRIALLAAYLEKAGKLARLKAGKTFKLLPPGSPEIPPPAAKREIKSHRKGRGSPPLREIDIAALEYVPLPRSPLKWEIDQAEREEVSPAEEPFEVRDANWTIESIDKLRPADRPDPAFRLAEAGAAGVFMVDGTGRAQNMGPIPAAALRYDHAGNVAVKAPLLHDVYRLGVHPVGHGLIALSREGALHAYDDDLEPVIETALPLAPEIVAIREKFGIEDDALRNHIRCIGLSRDGQRYLFTVVDEAWCVGRDGVGLWGAKLPIKDGWARVATPSSGFCTSEGVEGALKLMGLKLPITPDDLKSRYRSLAKQWHPDLNPGNPTAGEKMVALSAAAEILTGIEGSALPDYAGARFAQELHRSTVDVGDRRFTFTASLVVNERYAADWIYAAGFAANTDGAYLAGYSGRVVQVDANGVGMRVYDIGAVPRQIVDTGEYLYLLTFTRLYVLRDAALHALIDTYDGGDLIFAQNGFGLLEKKRLRWFAADGAYLGSVVTRDPIRRVFYAEGKLVIETRQLRARILNGTS